MLGVGYLLLATTTGMRASIKLMSALLPGQLSTVQAEGCLWNQFSLTGLIYQTPTYRIRIQRLQANWQLWKLVTGHLPIQHFSLNDAQLYEFNKNHKSKLILKIAQLHLNGQLSVLATQPLNLRIDWQGTEFWIKNKQSINQGYGQLSIQGSRNDYQWQLNSKLPGINFPTSIWQLAGHGTATSLQLNPSSVQLLDGTITAQGTLNWQTQLAWQLNLQATQLNPGKLWPNMPGNVNFQLASQGNKQTEVRQTLALNHVSGNLHNKPLAGHALIKISGSNLYVDNLKLTAGDALINIDGYVNKDWNLHWQITIPDLHNLVTNGYGNLHTNGTITGLRAQPTINTTLQGQQLQLGNYLVKAIRANGHINLANTQASQFNLHAQQLQYDSVKIEKVHIDLTGTTMQQTLLATVITPKEHYALQAISRDTQQQWQIQVPQFTMHSQRFSNWQLNTPIIINLSGKKRTIEPFCWQASQQKACFNNISWQDKDQWQIALQGQNIDLNVVNLWLPETISVTGHANLQVAANTQAGQTQAQTSLDIGVAHLHYAPTRQPPKSILIHDINATGKLNKKGLQANVQAIAFDQPLNAALELPGYQNLEIPEPTQPLRGQVNFTMDDISILSALIPNTSDITGLLQLKLNVAGTVKKPKLQGKALLTQAGFTLPAYNTQVEKIQGTITGQDNGNIHYELTGQAGPNSQLKLTGSADLFAHPFQSKTHLVGSHATIVNTEQYIIIADPDVQLLTQGNHLTLTGVVTIPEATIKPTDFSHGVVELPEDVEIIGGDQISTQSTIPFTMQLRLKAGEQVKVDAKGLRCRIEGNTILYSQPQHVTTATGQLNILEGTYNVYGENLTIRTGRLIYAGGPIDNPALNIQAVRGIKTSLLDQITVGVNVQGRLKQPNVNLFSEPGNLSQADILSYLLTGAPISQISDSKGQLLFKAATMLNPMGGGNQISNLKEELQTNLGIDELDLGTLQQYSAEKGAMIQNTSLMLGKQLTPKLHLGYSVGITEHINTFSLRYLLWRKLLLQTQTTGQNSGIDLIYTIER